MESICVPEIWKVLLGYGNCEGALNLVHLQYGLQNEYERINKMPYRMAQTDTRNWIGRYIVSIGKRMVKALLYVAKIEEYTPVRRS
jgi:hypothetical protein